MRTTSDSASVRLYHLDDQGNAVTLMYGTMVDALATAANEGEETQDGLYLQTDNDVVAYLDLI